jgi:hypothetical protein
LRKTLSRTIGFLGPRSYVGSVVLPWGVRLPVDGIVAVERYAGVCVRRASRRGRRWFPAIAHNHPWSAGGRHCCGLIAGYAELRAEAEFADIRLVEVPDLRKKIIDAH